MKSLVNPTGLRITMGVHLKQKKQEKNQQSYNKRWLQFSQKLCAHKKNGFFLWNTEKGGIDAECGGVEASGCLYKASSKSTTMALALSHNTTTASTLQYTAKILVAQNLQ